MKEKIIASAIKFRQKDNDYDVVMTAKRHADVFYKMKQLNIDYDRASCVQGFWTSEYRFVNRYEAKKIAVDVNQIIVPIEETYAELYSEDLW